MPLDSSAALTVHVGTHVVVELLDRDGRIERLEVDIVPDRMADLASGFLGEGTPLARALAHQPAGALVPYRQADIVQVRVVSVTAATSTASDQESLREAMVRKAVEAAERTNAILFASSFTGKWGDYEPEGMDNWDSTQKEGNDAPQSQATRSPVSRPPVRGDHEEDRRILREQGPEAPERG
jgi:hypothetical protein